MTITVEAVYEDGVLKPVPPLPLQEHDRVQSTVHTEASYPADLLRSSCHWFSLL
jgi:predicted DNA-binding antitoxin AbrB/MazE fold protein